MELWLVFCAVTYEGDYLVGIFISEELAKNYVTNVAKSQHECDEIHIQRWELNKDGGFDEVS
jgi:hypothetical protein